MSLKYAFIQVQKHFLPDHLSGFINIEDDSIGDYIAATVYVFVCTLKNIQLCYCGLFLLISIYGLAVVSKNFQTICKNDIKAKQIVLYYKTACRLSRHFGKYFGWGLLMFIWSGVFSYTFWFVATKEYSHFGTVILTIFRLWGIGFNIAVTGLELAFMKMVDKT